MSDESTERLYFRTARPPWREILSHRWSGTRDWSLVLKDAAGDYFVLGRRGDPEDAGAYAPVPGEVAPPGVGGRYTDVFRVDATEHVDTRAIGLPTVYGTESVVLWVSWWVHDPVRVVHTKTVHGWHVIRTHLTGALRHLAEAQTVAGNGLGAPEILQHFGAPQRVEATGLSYRVFDVRLRETGEELLLGQEESQGVRYSWTASRRGEYEFCLQALHAGPVSLAALWLLRHPDQVRQVLDWAVDHRDLLSPPHTDWQEELASLLGTLTDQERKEISCLLRDRISALGHQVPGGVI
ncbi:hypothetical protein [Streptomyces noursei]|uniref:hypothetical protein n=1 Tax=Streptomyces noursei TaxID=1971 RepID=UPI0016725F19|nr:hypothetical protein [Streptomyces noursei]MCZ1019594.1 hypothetical protein [Streptomyces noursei]GGX09796.1 hypothetical protein GCM10010341_34370 [Streptomyces noursei]